MKPRLFAFWKYDLFPYCLGGEITRINDNGLVYIESYMSSFKPFLILPYEEGIKRQQQLNDLELKYKDVLARVREEYTAKIETIIGRNLVK